MTLEVSNDPKTYLETKGPMASTEEAPDLPTELQTPGTKMTMTHELETEDIKGFAQGD